MEDLYDGRGIRIRRAMEREEAGGSKIRAKRSVL
jgi:hypothetical protein